MYGSLFHFLRLHNVPALCAVWIHIIIQTWEMKYIYLLGHSMVTEVTVVKLLTVRIVTDL